jgi:two-component system, OmpR family, sensor kinase
MRSIQRHLGLWVLGASGLGALAIGLLLYLALYTELNEAKDDGLKLVATSVADDGAAAQAPGSRAAQRTEIVVQIWSRQGQALHTSNPRVGIAFSEIEGLQRQRIAGEDWDVHTVVRADRVAQAAQRAAAQQEEAAESAARLFLPFTGLIVIVGVAMIFALRRGLRPLDAAAADIAARSAASLASIDDRDMPREVQPLVRAINGLMQRLASAFEQQRLFVADAAHELRSPVTALKLQVQLLQAAPDDAARHAAVAELRAGVERVQRLIEQLLRLSRLEPGAAERRIESVALDQLVHAAVARFSRLAEHRDIDLGAQAERHVAVHGDARELETLIDNLIDNALRYTPDGGVVDVVADVHQTRPTLRVIDNGPGIQAEAREDVFDRFRRGDNVAHGEAGSGLGLALVRSPHDRHGAVVSLHTPASGRGLEARVVFDGMLPP